MCLFFFREDLKTLTDSNENTNDLFLLVQFTHYKPRQFIHSFIVNEP